jgi:hypothetical protein
MSSGDARIHHLPLLADLYALTMACGSARLELGLHKLKTSLVLQARGEH